MFGWAKALIYSVMTPMNNQCHKCKKTLNILSKSQEFDEFNFTCYSNITYTVAHTTTFLGG